MQITNTTDYALRIIDYLSEKGNLATEAELADNLKIPIRNISKIMNILKNNNLINSEMGFNGGYSLAKNPERISYFDVISATESSMNLNKCLERNGVCSRNCIETCNVRKVLLKVDLNSLDMNIISIKSKFSDLFNNYMTYDEFFNEFWDMVSLLETVLAHNKLEDHESLHNISFFTEQIYKELQLNFPEYGILDNEIENISKLATIHDIGKISTPYEVLNKKGKLTKEEMDIVKKHPEDGANMALKLPKCNSTKKLVHYAYNICLYHHERYDGHGYPMMH